MRLSNRFQSRFLARASRHKEYYEWISGSVPGPPALDKLLVWLKGDNASDTLKKDSINGYDFSIVNCPPDYSTDAIGNFELDAQGLLTWDSLLYEGWECNYSPPGVGDPGNVELDAADDGTLYTAGAPNILTLKSFINTDQMFMCRDPLRGFLVYSLPLVGSELADAQAWSSCTGYVGGRDNWALDVNGDPTYTADGAVILI